MAEEMITCDRCGAVYKKSMRYCMKCGKLNYSHPDNASMLKYEPKEEIGVTKFNIGRAGDTRVNPLSFESSFRYSLADKAGSKVLCIIFNIALLLVLLGVVFLFFYNRYGNLTVTISSNQFCIAMAFVIFFQLESIAMQFMYMKANKPWWSCLVPFYNLYVYFDIVMKKGIYFLLLLIPIYGIYVLFKSLYDLGKSFGYSGWLMIFLPFVMIPIIAFNTAAPYNNVYYIGERRKMNENVLAEDHQRNKAILVTMLSLIFISFGALIFFNFKYLSILYEKQKIVLAAPRIIDFAKSDLQMNGYVCSYGVNIYSDDGVYYIPFGLVGYDFGSEFNDTYGEYKGYVKVEKVFGKESYSISLYNDKVGMKEAKLKNIKSGKTVVEENFITEIPEGAVTCYKK